MTFLFLDQIADLVGAPDDLVAAARTKLFREPVRHEGLRRLPRPDVERHVASLVVLAAHERLRRPLIDAITAFATEAGAEHEMMTGEEPGSDGYAAAVAAAFDGNDCGIDPTVFEVGTFTAEAAADSVLVPLHDIVSINTFLCRAGVAPEMLDPLIDAVLTPDPEPTKQAWSLDEIAALIVRCGVPEVMQEEAVRSLLSGDADLRETGFGIMDCGPNLDLEKWLDGHVSLDYWLDERAMSSTPESDEADVATVLALLAPAAQTQAPAPVTEPTPAKPSKPVASEPSDLTRAVSKALEALFVLTKETDTNVAKVLGVEKAVVAQARKGVTPWAPNDETCGKLCALLGRYATGLSEALAALEVF